VTWKLTLDANFLLSLGSFTTLDALETQINFR